LSKTNDEQTKRTAHDVQLPAVAKQRSGFGEAWYFRRDGELVAHQGDQSAQAADAYAMLKWDLEDDDAVVHEGLATDDLPTDFKTIAADGGQHE
jgi:hypothetical protein